MLLVACVGVCEATATSLSAVFASVDLWLAYIGLGAHKDSTDFATPH